MCSCKHKHAADGGGGDGTVHHTRTRIKESDHVGKMSVFSGVC